MDEKDIITDAEKYGRQSGFINGFGCGFFFAVIIALIILYFTL